MKLLIPFLFISSVAFGNTVILYDDGSTYTVKKYEKVYVSGRTLYTSVNTRTAQPNQKRDYVPSEDVNEGIDPETGLPYCDSLGFGHTSCVQRPVEEEEQECDGFTFGGGDC